MHCSKCGSELSPNSAFCSKCGAPALTGLATPSQSKPAPSSYGYNIEKREKAADRSSLLIGGIIPLLLGAILAAAYFSIIDWFLWWAYFFIGLGIMLLFQALNRFRAVRYSGSILSLLASASIFLFIGVFGITGFRETWPLIILSLIVTGLIILTLALTLRSQAPHPESAHHP